MNKDPLFLNPVFLVSLSLWVLTVILTKRNKQKKVTILIGSLCIYLHFAGIYQLILVFALSFVTYWSAKKSSKNYLNFAILLNLIAILISKFIIAEKLESKLSLFVPLGISFFIFEFIHYLVEVKRGLKVERNFINFLCFSFFLPTIVSGPIRRFSDFNTQLNSLLNPKFDMVQTGLLKISTGFMYKYIGDYFAIIQSRIAEQSLYLFSHKESAILLISAYLRIFLDFAGYSYIAIGISNLIGIKFPRNFKAPYLSTSIIEFWDRWHISLSSWVRDYLYIPMGGSRVKFYRQSLNLIFCMLVIGLWHGLGLKFIIWGSMHGIALLLNHAARKISLSLNPKSSINTKVKRKKQLPKNTTVEVSNLTIEKIKSYLRIKNIIKLISLNLYISLSWMFFFYPPNIALKITHSFVFGVDPNKVDSFFDVIKVLVY